MDSTALDELAESSVDEHEQDSSAYAAWVAEVNAPIAGTTYGEDPRYSDRFTDIKHEVDKLSDCDYIKVFKLSCELLKEEAKDLRVAGYLVLSSAYLHGVEGVINSLEVYRVFLEKYWDGCFPSSDNAKISAVSWINNKKVSYFLERKDLNCSQELLDTLKSQIVSFNQISSEKTNDASQPFGVLSSWLEMAQLHIDEQSKLDQADRDAKHKVDQERREHERELAKLEELESQALAKDEQVRNLTERLVAEPVQRAIVVERLINQLVIEEKYIEAVLHARASKWGFEKAPQVSAEGATSIEFPAEVKLDILTVIENPVERLVACEKMFLEENAEFCFDLQMIAGNAAKDMHHKELLKTIKQQTGDLLDKFPDLIESSYQSGVQFASETARLWLDDIVKSRSDSNPLAALGNNTDLDKELDKAFKQAKDIVEDEDLNAGLRCITKLAMPNELMRVKQKLNMALLCVEFSRNDLAMPVLNELFNSTNSNLLHLWQPKLAMLLWQTLHTVLQEEKEKASDVFKEKIDQKLYEISEKMCTADLSMASQLLN